MAFGLHNVSSRTASQLAMRQLSRNRLRRLGLGGGYTTRRIGAFLEQPHYTHSSLTLLPLGLSLGPRVSLRVPCPHWLYVMEATNGLLKVGSTHQPAHRYRILRKALPAGVGLACRALYPLGTMTRSDAQQHEFEAHAELRRRYGRARKPNEWYRATLADVMAIVAGHASRADVAALVGLS